MSRPSWPAPPIASVSVLGGLACHSRGQGRSRRQDEVNDAGSKHSSRSKPASRAPGNWSRATALLQRMIRGERDPGTGVSQRRPRLRPRGLNRRPSTQRPQVIEENETKAARAGPPSAQRHKTCRGRSTAMRAFLRARPGRSGRNALRHPPVGKSPPTAQGSSRAPSVTRAGSRTYKLFIPSHSRGQQLPLVAMLHGCTQSPDDFASGTRMNFLAERAELLRGLS